MNNDPRDVNVEFRKQFVFSEELQKQGRFAEASDILVQLAIDFPADAVVHWRLGYVQLELDSPESAHASFDQALRIDSSCKQAIGGKGQAFAAECQWAAAELWYRRRLELADSPWYHDYLAQALIKMQRYAEAEAECQRALSASPDLGEAYLKLAYARYFQGNKGGAVEALDNAIRVEPECADVANEFRQRITNPS